MEMQQQVKNSITTQKTMSKAYQHSLCAGKHSNLSHEHHTHALQALSDGHAVPYSQTLRIVTHEGDGHPIMEPMETRKHPGYIRNELGGTFTS